MLAYAKTQTNKLEQTQKQTANQITSRHQILLQTHTLLPLRAALGGRSHMHGKRTRGWYDDQREQLLGASAACRLSLTAG